MPTMKNSIEHIKVLLHEVEMHLFEMLQDIEDGETIAALKDLADKNARLREEFIHFQLEQNFLK